MSKSPEKRKRDRTGSRRRSESSDTKPAESGWKSIILGTGYSDPNKRLKIGFYPVFFGLILFLIFAATLFYQWPKAKEESVVDFQDLASLVEHGTKDQLFERLKELGVEAKSHQGSSANHLLRLQNNIDINQVATRLLERSLDESRARTVASLFLRSGNEIVLMSQEDSGRNSFDRSVFESQVETLKTDIDVQIAKEAWFTGLLIAISNYVQSDDIEKSENRDSLESALTSLLSKYQDDLWVANNLQQLKPVFLDGKLEKQVRESIWTIIANHYSQSSQVALQQFAASSERVLVKLKYDFEKLDQLSRPGFENEFAQFKSIYQVIWDDPSLRPEVARQLLVFSKRFESRGEFAKAAELLDLANPKIDESVDWTPFVNERNKVQSRLSQIGLRVQIPSSWDPSWRQAFECHKTVVVFLGKTSSKRRVLLEQLVSLVRSRTDQLAVIVVYPESQQSFVANEMSVFQDKLDIKFFLESNAASGKYRPHFFAEQGNVAHLFQAGKLVRSNVGFDRLFSMVPNLK